MQLFHIKHLVALTFSLALALAFPLPCTVPLTHSIALSFAVIFPYWLPALFSPGFASPFPVPAHCRYHHACQYHFPHGAGSDPFVPAVRKHPPLLRMHQWPRRHHARSPAVFAHAYTAGYGRSISPIFFCTYSSISASVPCSKDNNSFMALYFPGVI